MLNRDFNKSNIEYIKKNKIPLISVAIFLLFGLIMAIVLGFNGNFEMKGYNEFGVVIGSTTKAERNEAIDDIKKIVNAYDAEFESYSITGEGGATEIVVRYTHDMSQEEIIKVNQEIAQKLELDINNISTHSSIEGAVRAEDYIFSAAAILLILLIASIFAMFRYNVASAIAIIISSAIGTLGFMSFASILRLSVGLSYFAMLVILNVMIIYFAFNIFETIRKESWLVSNEYSTAIQSALKGNKSRFNFLAIAISVIGLLFVIIGTPAIKFVSINIMFMAVTVLAVAYYVLPFAWNMLIGYKRLRLAKSNSKSNKDN